MHSPQAYAPNPALGVDEWRDEAYQSSWTQTQWRDEAYQSSWTQTQRASEPRFELLDALGVASVS